MNYIKRHHHIHHSDSEKNFQDAAVFKKKALRSIKIRQKLSSVLFYLLLLIAAVLLAFCIYAAEDDTAPNRHMQENFMEDF